MKETHKEVIGYCVNAKITIFVEKKHKMSEKRHIGKYLADALHRLGARNVVTSPGSRNSPIISVFAADDRFETFPVVDERQAGFIALGMAKSLDEPVVLICTSGSALLNYAPALAEAFYSEVPLIVISADRPSDRIGQNAGQTMVQYGALSYVTKTAIDISYVIENQETIDSVAKLLDANISIQSGKGPVHVNVHVPEPEILKDIKPLICEKYNFEKKSSDLHDNQLSQIDLKDFTRIMIYVGPNKPNELLNLTLEKLSGIDGVIILGDVASNINSEKITTLFESPLCQDATFVSDHLTPDLLITTGGPATSKIFSKFVSAIENLEHWDVSQSLDTRDAYNKLKKRFRLSPELFFEHLYQKISTFKGEKSFSLLWNKYAKKKEENKSEDLVWNAQNAVKYILEILPGDINLHLSNGMSVRYASKVDCRRFYKILVNRGVSGIEGALSTALGCSMSDNSRDTILITGDMSAYYDMSALFSPYVSNRLRVFIVNNRGGDIFRQIAATKDTEILERHLCCDHAPDWSKVALACGATFCRISCFNELKTALSLHEEMSNNLIICELCV